MEATADGATSMPAAGPKATNLTPQDTQTEPEEPRLQSPDQQSDKS